MIKVWFRLKHCKTFLSLEKTKQKEGCGDLNWNGVFVNLNSIDI